VKVCIILHALLITVAISGSAFAALDSAAEFAQVFKTADAQAEDIRAKEKDPFALKQKIANTYGYAIAQIIERATADPAHKDQLLALLDPRLQQHLNVKTTVQATPAQQEQVQTLLAESFEKFSSIPGSYGSVLADIINLAKNQYGANATIRAIILDTLKSYIRTLVNEHMAIDTIFNQKSITDAINQVLTQELKDKTPVQSRMMVNILMDKLIQKTGAKISQAAAQNEGKTTTEEVVSWFKNYNNGNGATSMPDMSALIQKIVTDNYPAEKLFLILTTVRNLLTFAVTPTPIQLPQATQWLPPAKGCKWYDVSCSIPWNAIGDGLKTAFSKDVWENKVGGGLKVAFVDNVYEKGLKKIGEGIAGGVEKLRNMAHSIRDAIRGIAYKISSTPETINSKAAAVIGSPDLATQLQGGADKLSIQIRTIMATIDSVKQQKEDVKKQNLASKKIKELTNLNTLLTGDGSPFDDVVDALQFLVSNGTMSVKKNDGAPITDWTRVTNVAVDENGKLIENASIQKGKVSKDGTELEKAIIVDEGIIDKEKKLIKDAVITDNCTRGALCEIRASFKGAKTRALEGEKNIRSNISELDRKINHPNFLQDSVAESLPNRLRNVAKLLDI
jgi:hypothetical protein